LRDEAAGWEVCCLEEDMAVLPEEASRVARHNPAVAEGVDPGGVAAEGA